MKYTYCFINALNRHFPVDSASLLHRLDIKYSEIQKDVSFVKKSSNPIDKRLYFTAYLLALIKILEHEGIPFDRVKDICLEITYDSVSPKNWFQKHIKRLIPKLLGSKISKIALKQFNKKTAKRSHIDGFRAEIISDKDDTFGLGYGVNILECGICKLFQKHQATSYSSILCEVDKVTSELAGLQLIREGTIALGAEACDFRWKTKTPDDQR